MNGLVSDSDIKISNLKSLSNSLKEQNRNVHDMLCIVIDINFRHISCKDGREKPLLEISVIDNSFVNSGTKQNQNILYAFK